MPGTMKFSISMPASEFKALEAGRRKAGRTRSQYIRDILSAEAEGVEAKEMSKRTQARVGPGSEAGRIGEERSAYGPPLPEGLTEGSELRRRAIAAAGRFESGLPDLSIGHDRHLADPPAEDGDEGPGTSGEARGAR
jgi:predicted DNA-binding protein